MNEEKTKEILNNHRLNKTFLWNYLLATIVGTLGLFYKILKYKGDLIDVTFIILGILVVAVLLKMLQDEAKNINKMLNKFDKEEN